MNINIDLIIGISDEPLSFKGNSKLVFRGMQTTESASSEEICWIKPTSQHKELLINTTSAGAIICDKETADLYKGNADAKLLIVCPDPKRLYFLLAKYIDGVKNIQQGPKIHSTAIIHKDCVLGENVEIGEFSVIGACVIGHNTKISNHVKIYDRVSIGNNCKVREFCSIGGQGFGYFKSNGSINQHIPHIGEVVIEDNVEIFPFSNVDKGTLGKTWIMSGTVIDHYVHIGHNTTTGKNNIITAGTILAGGSKIGDNCFLGVHTNLKEKCEIGSNVITGMGSVVIKNIPSNEIWVGNPARFLRKNIEA